MQNKRPTNHSSISKKTFKSKIEFHTRKEVLSTPKRIRKWPCAGWDCGSATLKDWAMNEYCRRRRSAGAGVHVLQEQSGRSNGIVPFAVLQHSTFTSHITSHHISYIIFRVMSACTSLPSQVNECEILSTSTSKCSPSLCQVTTRLHPRLPQPSCQCIEAETVFFHWIFHIFEILKSKQQNITLSKVLLALAVFVCLSHPTVSRLCSQHWNAS